MRKCSFGLTSLVMLCLVLSISMVNASSLVKASSLLKSNPQVDRYLESKNGIPLFVSGRLSTPVQAGGEIEATYNFLRENVASYKMTNPATELVINRAEVDRQGHRHIRFDQYYYGLPVYGAELISHFSKDGILTALNGNYLSDISVNRTPTVLGTTVAQLALDDLAGYFGTAEPVKQELIVFRWEEIDYLAWRLMLFSESPMGNWEYFIDAQTGEVIFKANRIMSEGETIGTGTGIMGGNYQHIDTKVIDGLYYMLDYTRLANNDIHGHGGLMPDGSYIRCYLAGSSLPGVTATDADNVWDDYAGQSAAVDAMVYTSLMYDWMLRVFDRNSYNDNGASMKVSVGYYGEGYNNAYWNGSRIVIWAASAGSRELAGCPDVIAHEWGHAITTYTSSMIYQKESGALNESFSDMIGVAFEYDHDSLDAFDWYMGENIRSGSTGFRNVANPNAKNDPDYYGGTYFVAVDGCYPSNTNDWCGVHTNSGIGNKWFYLMSEGGLHHEVTVAGIGIQNAIQVAYQANKHYWTSSTTYVEAAYGTVLAANDLDPTGEWAVQADLAWEAVGVLIPDNGLEFIYYSGLPSALDYNTPTVVDFRVAGTFHGNPVRDYALFYYSIDGGDEIVEQLSEYVFNRYKATLPALECGSDISYYFSAVEVDNGIFYDTDPSRPHRAHPSTGLAEIANVNLSFNPGWTLEEDWAYGRPNGNGGSSGFPDPTAAYSLSNVYGYNLNGDYTNSMAPAHLTSTPFDCSGMTGVVLNFQRWLGVDVPENDQASISVSTNGIDFVTVWENATAIEDIAWTYMEVDISDVADNQPEVYLRWTMGATDDDGRSCGWNIDDIALVSHLCVPWACGDLSGDLKANLADITQLIDFVYISKAPLQVPRAGNVDGSSDGKINLADITVLIDHVYISRDPLNCP